MKHKWLLIIVGPALFMIVASIAAALFFPFPIPKQATPAQRLYLANCATCHGADGGGSWRATLFLMRLPDLRQPGVIDSLSDEYLFTLIRNGGATLGKPGMPAFGYHLNDEEIRELVRYLRTPPKR